MHAKQDLSAIPRGQPLVDEFTVSLNFDKRLYKEEIAVSIAHAKTLEKAGTISASQSHLIQQGLLKIKAEITSGKFPWRNDLEDIHMNIESRLYEIIGDTAGCLHTARSRNDQIVTVTRLFVMSASYDCLKALRNLQYVLLEIADANKATIMPGYTHLQRAQPVRLSHHILAYFEMFTRDAKNFTISHQSADTLPLGSGALAGVPYPIDREFTAQILGFSIVSRNSIDAVSDRDYIVSFIQACAQCTIHLSRLAEELIYWASTEFGFIQLPNGYTTGSSIMPQKRNPDYAEIVRAKSSRVIGSLVGILTLLKSLPLAYNRDLQEDKSHMFQALDATLSSIEVMSGMLKHTIFKSKVMNTAAESGHAIATDLADYLVKKGLPFRESYATVVELWNIAVSRGVSLNNLPFVEYKNANPLFEPDVMNLSPQESADSRDIYGGTAYKQVITQIQNAKEYLKNSDVKDINPPNV